jgi:Na+/melibiose symporter-like transporter
MGPFDFWAAGTDSGIPPETRRWPRRSFWMTVAALVVVIVLVAIFVNPR